MIDDNTMAALAARARSSGLALAAAAEEIRRVGATDPQVAQAAEDTLTAVTSTVEGRRGGPSTDAAERSDKAARARAGGPVRGVARTGRTGR